MNEDSLSGLLCEESEICLYIDEEVVSEDTNININNHSALDDEYVRRLVDRESSFGFKQYPSLESANWVNCARMDAVTWILKTRAVLGFRFQTAYLSMTYFDRFLSRRPIDSEKSLAKRLLAMACLSIAAKIEEIEIPSLSQFQIEGFNFESSWIRRMELLVLNTLEWRMRSITPFAFLHHFIMKLCKESPPCGIVSRSSKLILTTMREINLMEFRPSVIAAAATLVALDQRLTRKALECKMNSIRISHCGFLEFEDAFQCYSLMQKIGMEKLKISAPMINSPPDLSPTHLRQTDAIDNSSICSPSSNKRRRLTFNDGDQSFDKLK
ncbi:Cyclin_N domain-containing protein/Cyclin_C domain-containing protein [Cephalotus follicularis]|uniref:B-like cyclin n=1 Tax=Cephalotus follicularis TaxID=3775 RepID=A0A1Q3AR15_CEPFO|nr:Cyclin_N domain-containing protein/Cyclin_C domain-containing protein [Cephalotus follicularis]